MGQPLLRQEDKYLGEQPDQHQKGSIFDVKLES